MKLPNVRTFARVHGWIATVDTDYQAGVRLVVDGVTTDPEADADADERANRQSGGRRKERRS